MDSERYVTGEAVKNNKWYLNNNLLGNRDYCPIIRLTPRLNQLLKTDISQILNDVTHVFTKDMFYRAINFLYTKETRSSYQIEQEKPSTEKIVRFVRLLEQAGKMPIDERLSETNLVALQNAIVDSHYAAKGFRNFHNYVGQTAYNYREVVHYICPPPAIINSLMDGLKTASLKSKKVHPIVLTTIVSFGFVFIHPFEDGNGRLHRFLIHDTLARCNFIADGMIIPVSANMLNHIRSYDTILEKYSRPLMARVKYELSQDNQIKVLNTSVVEAYYRYPDLTDQAIYLAETIIATIKEDIYSEIDFLTKYDEVKQAFQEIVDMPNQRFDLLVKLLHQNQGQLASRKRSYFNELSDAEIRKMESVFKEIFFPPSS